MKLDAKITLQLHPKLLMRIHASWRWGQGWSLAHLPFGIIFSLDVVVIFYACRSCMLSNNIMFLVDSLRINKLQLCCRLLAAYGSDIIEKGVSIIIISSRTYTGSTDCPAEQTSQGPLEPELKILKLEAEELQAKQEKKKTFSLISSNTVETAR